MAAKGGIYRHANTCYMMTQLSGFREGRLVLVRWLPLSFSPDYIMHVVCDHDFPGTLPLL